MDKLLAMSILSTGPDSSAVNWWLSHITAGDSLRTKKEVENANEKEKRASRGRSDSSDSSKYSLGNGKGDKPRFAMEFDGLNCFETIISH